MNYEELKRWTPGDCRRRNKAECAELDEHVRLLDWTEAARRPGSQERMLVASWLECSGIVEDALDRCCPKGLARETMRDWIAPRMVEKVLQTSVQSDLSRWTRGNMWDPDNGGSFCGWARGLAELMLKRNSRRELDRRPKLHVDLRREDDDDRPDALDKAAAPTEPGGLDVLVPRPMGRDRRMLKRLLKSSGDVGAVADRARRMGLWDRSLDDVDEARAVALMLGDLKRGDVERVVAARRTLDLDDELVEAFALTQTRSGSDGRDLAPQVTRAARANGCGEWDVWVQLGTLVASCV